MRQTKKKGQNISAIRSAFVSSKNTSPPTTASTPSKRSMLSVSEQEELAQLRKENRALKAKLKDEEPGHKAYKLLVEPAEETYDIEILKNSAAK